MSLSEEQLRADMKTAMREKDKLKTGVLRGLISAIKNKQIETKSDTLDEKELTAIVKREAKQCRETLDAAKDAGRAEMVAEHEAILGVLEAYLPKQMSEDELTAAIKAIIAETGADAMGAVMKELGARHQGAYDGKTASKLASQLLAG